MHYQLLQQLHCQECHILLKQWRMLQQYAIPVKVGVDIPVQKYVIVVVKAHVIILVTKLAQGLVVEHVQAIAINQPDINI